MFTQDRDQLRKVWLSVLEKMQDSQPMSPLEQQIASVLMEHPEYHQQISRTESDYLPDNGVTNPFLHMGMHLALREQISTNRPAGVSECHATLCQQTGSAHEAEHRMMECLAEALWSAQQHGGLPDETAYLECLEKTVKNL